MAVLPCSESVVDGLQNCRERHGRSNCAYAGAGREWNDAIAKAPTSGVG